MITRQTAIDVETLLKLFLHHQLLFPSKVIFTKVIQL